MVNDEKYIKQQQFWEAYNEQYHPGEDEDMEYYDDEDYYDEDYNGYYDDEYDYDENYDTAENGDNFLGMEVGVGPGIKMTYANSANNAVGTNPEISNNNVVNIPGISNMNTMANLESSTDLTDDGSELAQYKYDIVHLFINNLKKGISDTHQMSNLLEDIKYKLQDKSKKEGLSDETMLDAVQDLCECVYKLDDQTEHMKNFVYKEAKKYFELQQRIRELATNLLGKFVHVDSAIYNDGSNGAATATKSIK